MTARRTSPTVAEVRRYLHRHGWRPSETSSHGTVWWQTPGGTHVVIPNWPDNDTRLLEYSMVINVLAGAEGHTTIEQIPLTVANILVNDEDFHGCSRDCWPRDEPESGWQHTLVYGRCAIAVEPPAKPATLNIPYIGVAGDGGPSMSWTSVPLTLFSPWAEYLPPSDQQEMLAEIADADPEDRPLIMAGWRRTAQQLADPQRRAVLLGLHDSDDFVEALRPGGDGDA